MAALNASLAPVTSPRSRREQASCADPAGTAQARCWRLFGELYVGLVTARVSRQRTEAKLRSGQRPGPEASAGKLEMTRNLARIVTLVEQVLGDRLVADTGEWGTFAWADLVLGLPGLRIAGGTDEVQRNIIAERVLGLPR